jgi:hypothetical protein
MPTLREGCKEGGNFDISLLTVIIRSPAGAVHGIGSPASAVHDIGSPASAVHDSRHGITVYGTQ